MAKNGNNVSQKVGVVLLSVGTAAGVWSAVNPSYFSLGAFVRNKEARDLARQGVFIGLGLGALVTTGVAIAFPKNPLAWISSAMGFIILGTISLIRLESNGDGVNLPPPPGALPAPTVIPEPKTVLET